MLILSSTGTMDPKKVNFSVAVPDSLYYMYLGLRSFIFSWKDHPLLSTINMFNCESVFFIAWLSHGPATTKQLEHDLPRNLKNPDHGC